MSDSIDRVFVKAISTIKALSARKGSASLPQPPVESRISLYGLYKQATEGDVDGVMSRPTGNSNEDIAGRRKWDAWKQQQGIGRTEAKRRYVSFLIETMHSYASETQEARELLSELEYLWDQIKDIPASDSPSPDSVGRQLDSVSVVAAAVAAAGNIGYAGSLPGSYMTSSYDRGVTSKLGAHRASPSEASARRAAGSESLVLDTDNSDNLEMRKWRRDVNWALETINEEIMAMRHRYAASASGGLQMPLQMTAPTQYVPDRGTGSSNGGHNDPRNSHYWLIRLLGDVALGVFKHFIIDTVLVLAILRFIRWLRRHPRAMVGSSPWAACFRILARSLSSTLSYLHVEVLVG